jgi:hypothetical protein
VRAVTAAVLALVAAAPAHAAPAREISLDRRAGEQGGYVLSADRAVRAGRTVTFSLALEDVHTGGVFGRAYRDLDHRRIYSVQMECIRGVSFVFGMTSRTTSRLRAVFGDGATATIRLRRAPRAWRPRKQLFGRAFDAQPVALRADGARIPLRCR